MVGFSAGLVVKRLGPICLRSTIFLSPVFSLFVSIHVLIQGVTVLRGEYICEVMQVMYVDIIKINGCCKIFRSLAFDRNFY